MSASIRINCDRENRYGTCAQVFHAFGAPDVPAARQKAAAAGWGISAAADYCPTCRPKPPRPLIRP